MEDLETTIMELLVNAGAARSAALTALQMARKGDFDEAEKAMSGWCAHASHTRATLPSPFRLRQSHLYAPSVMPSGQHCAPHPR